MATKFIDYATKVVREERPEIPLVNKVTDNDMNSIKETVNNNGGVETIRFFGGSGRPSALYIEVPPGNTIINDILKRGELIGMMHMNYVPYDPGEYNVFIVPETGTLNLANVGGLQAGQKLVLVVKKSLIS